ncbi:MAG: PIN domain-containing protein [Paludibacterium sp.]|uniref:type II toxin-antitoxin system VapC family toxin n=1 Tax=Paludibacterium sp. TaxID=1917523 RepID=UPI0025E50F86|nr:PIN domain-containing protein [Paludibacterium sp.]MBV8046045.1 PIN domain-containing protein [Paludibacterium sp.]
MSTVIDANVLIALFSDKTDDARGIRVKGLLEDARKLRQRLFVPTPALSEFAAKAHTEELEFIQSQLTFRVVPFAAKAALECGELFRTWVTGGDKTDRHKAKFDMQIVAIMKAVNATLLISGDKNLRNRAKEQGIPAMDILELDIPDSSRQTDLFKDSPEEDPAQMAE